MTETSQRQTLTSEYDRNIDEFDQKMTTTTNINHDYIFNFQSYSPVIVRRRGNIYYIFGHIHHVNVCRCQFFGYVHQFRSNSFGHLDSIK